METLMYLAKTNLYLVLFYCTYWLFFRKHTFFQWNRFYLLGAIAASFLLPSIILYTEVSVPIPNSEVIEVVNGTGNVIQVAEVTNPWPVILLICYAAGVFFMLARLFRSLRRLFVLIKNGDSTQLENYTLIFLNKDEFGTSDCGSFSFFKWMIVNRSDYEHNSDTIFRHEYVHIRQLHSVDILLIECLKVVFWFNPAVWFYKHSMQAVHEYLADSGATSRDSYAKFLVAYALKIPEQMLTNHFSNSSLLKDRIKMIYKNRTSNWLLSKYLLILPLVLVTVMLTAAKKYISQHATPKSNVLVDDAVIHGTVSDQKGNRIPGANVIVKNTTQGAATDRDGKFELKNIGKNATIVVSHIKFKSKEVAIKAGQSSYDIVIEPDDTILQGPTTTRNPATPKTPPAKTITKDKNPDMSGYKVAEQKPEFPGGQEAMMEYLRAHMKYPDAALKANVEGVVIVRFMVNKEGALNSVVIVKGIGFGLDGESVRLVKDMPKWKPGIQNGEPIEMAQTIEIKFDLAAAKSGKRQGFYLPKPNPVLNFQIAKVKIEDVFRSSLALFEPETFNRYQTQPKAEYKFVPDSSSYRFMNYNTVSPEYRSMTLRPSGSFKYHKE